MNKKISVFLPTRKGSERVKNKNTRPFSVYKGGLLQLKLEQLILVTSIQEIILSSNDENALKIGKEFESKSDKIKVIERPDFLALSNTKLSDLVEYVPSVCSFDHILWTHVTSPFVTNLDYENAIVSYFTEIEKGFDSLMSVRHYQNFLWDKNQSKIINKISELKWPRTQDLKIWFEINSAIFIAAKKIYENENDRIGTNPFLFKQNELQSFDIDWEEDFELAELIFNAKLK
jgi:CMP-N-acetylneuraminic acid synthetase